jgi:RimJ/RimL family protein N-acetyltransferase
VAPEAAILRSQRLVGEPAVESHLPGLRRLFADPAVGRTLAGVRSAREVDEILARWRRGWEREGFGVWVFGEPDGAGFVGYGGLGMARAIAVAGEVEVLYGLVPEAWGRGFATEMARAAVDFGFREHGLPALVGYTQPVNRGSRRVLEKCGFVSEHEGSHAGLPHVFYRLERKRWARGRRPDELQL